MLARISATQFIRPMTTGRTCPILCGCVDQNDQDAGEYVVKLLRNQEAGASGALLEFAGSRLARHFDILVPEPAAVHIDPSFAQAIIELRPELSAPLRASVGLNFGSKVVNPMTTWLVGRPIPEAMWRDATSIFAFDALIQNPDRRIDNPNLFTRGDEIYVYDHETSFSFLYALLPSATPWLIDGEAYLERHVFYGRLKSKEIDLSDFLERLNALTVEALAGIRADLPPEWMDQKMQRIEAHLLEIRDHSEEFIEGVRRRLA
jgi:HipA-like kinase